ncbi:pci domain-containing protein [Rutstroemia sp. NJR-2017a BBW]|nr:pci domain-containing protein [Rutstroemia sp. NJR-2017a BBW]
MHCICSNLSIPALSSYTNTLPTFLCEQHYANCILANQNDAAAQRACSNYERQNCGRTDPETIRASNPISILPLSTPISISTSEPSTLSDSIPITRETTTVTPTGTTTVLVTSTSTPGQSFGGGEGNATDDVSGESEYGCDDEEGVRDFKLGVGVGDEDGEWADGGGE